MSKVAIMTDSNAGITQAEAKELGIAVLPMPFYINEELFFEDVSLTQEQFYEKLAQDAEISTSQPAIPDFTGMWDDLLKTYDEVVCFPMSSGLSGFCSTAMAMSQDYDGKVQVVDNQRISITLKASVLDAIKLAEEGKSALEIKEYFEAEKHEQSIYIMVDTLKYLKKGGRITPAAALFGEVLNIKPVLQIQGDKLDAFSKCRGPKQAKKVMINALQHDIDNRFPSLYESGNLKFYVIHSENLEEAESLAAEVKEIFPKARSVEIDKLSLSVACHIGPGSLAVAVSKCI